MKTQLVPKPTKKSCTPAHFFGVLAGAASVSHCLHLQATGESSFSVHKALDRFYKDVPELVDSVIETFQGAQEKIVRYDAVALTYGLEMPPLEYMRGLREMIITSRFDIIPEGLSNVHNELDNVLTLIDGTIYKLRFLK